jgi:hypothetical protein
MDDARRLYSSMLFWNDYLNQPPMPPWENLSDAQRIVLERAMEDIRQQNEDAILRLVDDSLW